MGLLLLGLSAPLLVGLIAHPDIRFRELIVFIAGLNIGQGFTIVWMYYHMKI